MFYSYYKRGRPAAGRVLQWLASNLGTARYARKNIPFEKYIPIRYEDFAANPTRVLETIAYKTGVTINADTLIEDINTQDSYRFGGNGMRCQEIQSMRPDTGWRSNLARYYRLVLAPVNWLGLMFVRPIRFN